MSSPPKIPSTKATKLGSPKLDPPPTSPQDLHKQEEVVGLSPHEPTSNFIEAEEVEYDDEDGYETDQMTTGSMSISSSIRAHTFEDGLRYHKFHDGKYAFPNDENEQNRDDMKHAMTLMICGDRLHFAPIGDNPQRIIDLGTGTGIWAIEMADSYPSAQVTGIDLSPIQPDWVPPNLHFILDDFEDEWVYPAEHFDFIHMRHTLHSVQKPVVLMERAFKHAKPGGWVEFQELHYYPHCDDETMDKPTAFQNFLKLVRDGVANLGSDLNGVANLRNQVTEAGFINVKEDVLKLPIGIWPKNKTLKLAGLYWRTAILDGLMSVAKRPIGKGLGWSMQEIELLLVDVRKCLMDSSIHSYMPLHMVYGQKPMQPAKTEGPEEE